MHSLIFYTKQALTLLAIITSTHFASQTQRWFFCLEMTIFFVTAEHWLHSLNLRERELKKDFFIWLCFGRHYSVWVCVRSDWLYPACLRANDHGSNNASFFSALLLDTAKSLLNRSRSPFQRSEHEEKSVLDPFFLGGKHARNVCLCLLNQDMFVFHPSPLWKRRIKKIIFDVNFFVSLATTVVQAHPSILICSMNLTFFQMGIVSNRVITETSKLGSLICLAL